MISHKILSFSMLLILLCGTLSHASPFLDRDTKNWMAKANLEKKITTSNNSFRALIILNSDRNDKQLLRSKKIELSKSLFSLRTKFNFLEDGRKIDELWAVHSVIIDLNRNELFQLINSGEISAIYDAGKKIKIRNSILSPDQFQTLAFVYTYGLKNIKVPDLLKVRPDLTGAGVKIGILDTGLYAAHPDIVGRLSVFKNFSPSPDDTVRDPFGHGTHVAGTIAGGAKSGTAIGVAPKAELIVGRIFDGNGESTKELILKAMQWIMDPDENLETTLDRPRVVNNSWGDNDPYNDRDPQDDPFCIMIDSWIAAGVVPVFTAGNTGPRPKSINVPGACPGSLTVGATEQYDRSLHFSSEGPTSWKTVEIIKPDVVAPGVDIKSLGNYGNEYEVMSGTSMAAPHVSGSVALLFQGNPNLTADQAIMLMRSTAKDLGKPGKDNTFGDGRIDILKAIQSLNE